MQKRDIQAVISICFWMLTLSLSAAVSIFIIIVAAITAYRWKELLMITKTIAVCQMATVLGRTMTAIRECIARDKFPFAQCWQTEGKKGRTFSIDREGFRFYLANTLGWPEEKINEAFKEAHIV